MHVRTTTDSNEGQSCPRAIALLNLTNKTSTAKRKNVSARTEKEFGAIVSERGWESPGRNAFVLESL
jgi:hypothetical protein